MLHIFMLLHPISPTFFNFLGVSFRRYSRKFIVYNWWTQKIQAIPSESLKIMPFLGQYATSGWIHGIFKSPMLVDTLATCSLLELRRQCRVETGTDDKRRIGWPAQTCAPSVSLQKSESQHGRMSAHTNKLAGTCSIFWLSCYLGSNSWHASSHPGYLFLARAAKAMSNIKWCWR